MSKDLFKTINNIYIEGRVFKLEDPKRKESTRFFRTATYIHDLNLLVQGQQANMGNTDPKSSILLTDLSNINSQSKILFCV